MGIFQRYNQEGYIKQISRAINPIFAYYNHIELVMNRLKERENYQEGRIKVTIELNGNLVAIDTWNKEFRN